MPVAFLILDVSQTIQQRCQYCGGWLGPSVQLLQASVRAALSEFQQRLALSCHQQRRLGELHSDSGTSRTASFCHAPGSSRIVIIIVILSFFPRDSSFFSRAMTPLARKRPESHGSVAAGIRPVASRGAGGLAGEFWGVSEPQQKNWAHLWLSMYVSLSARSSYSEDAYSSICEQGLSCSLH